MAVEQVIEGHDFQSLLDSLRDHGYMIYGPTVREEAVVLDEVTRVEDLPVSLIDHQEAGSYRLEQTGDGCLFAYTVGPHSWKRFLYPPQQEQAVVVRRGQGFEIERPEAEVVKAALLGVRSCDLHALKVLDKVLLEGPYADPVYRRRREETLIVAVNCTRAGGTCFCRSMGTGPRVTLDHDLLLTEVCDSSGHYFVAQAGSERGAAVLAGVSCREATESEVGTAEEAVAQAASQMGRELETEGLKEALAANFDHLHWEEVAERCLTCGNCTMVCPTCFCSTMQEWTDLSGQRAGRRRLWDVCFSVEFSYIHGGSVRSTASSRYRQWLLHKLSYWQDQFGASGCVGCGRCITWCPVGIDICEEASAVRRGA